MSDEIVSLFALMDSHLSKTSLNETSSENDGNNTSHSGSHILLPTPPGPRLAIPKFFSGNSPMKDFLAEKISMTLKAKEKRKEQEEQRKIEEEMRRLKIKENIDTRCIEEGTRQMKISHKDEYLIDLTSSIIKQPKPGQVSLNNDGKSLRGLFNSEEGTSNSISFSSITDFGLYRTSVSELTLANDESCPGQSVPAGCVEDNILVMPKVEWPNECEEAPMTEEEERQLKIKQKESLWIEEELRKMKIRHEQEYPPLELLNEMMPKPKPVRVKPQPPVNDRVTKRLLFDKETCLYKEWDPTLPCTTDISYILKNSMKRGKCSTFGKVLCSRVRPIYRMSIPYAREKLNSNIVRFDFKTKSPADIYKENQTSLNKKQTHTKLPARFMLDLMECI